MYNFTYPRFLYLPSQDFIEAIDVQLDERTYICDLTLTVIPLKSLLPSVIIIILGQQMFLGILIN